jgi:hypothetical protein
VLVVHSGDLGSLYSVMSAVHREEYEENSSCVVNAYKFVTSVSVVHYKYYDETLIERKNEVAFRKTFKIV